MSVNTWQAINTWMPYSITADLSVIANSQSLHSLTAIVELGPIEAQIGHVANSQTLKPVTPMQMVTLAGLDPESWLNNPPYIGNAGGDGNNIGTGDEIYYSLSTSPGGYPANISDMGIASFDDGGAATEDQTITWFYRDAQNGYAESATQQLTLTVDNSIEAFIGHIINNQTLHSVDAVVQGDEITSNVGHITNSQVLHQVQGLIGTQDPIVVNLGSITNSQVLHDMTAGIDPDLVGNIGSITNSQSLHPLTGIVELGPIEAQLGHLVNTQALHAISVTISRLDLTYMPSKEALKISRANDLVFLHDGSSIPYTAAKDPNSRIYKGFTLLGLESDENITAHSFLINGSVVSEGQSVDGLTFHGSQANGVDQVKAEISGGTEGVEYTLTMRYSTQYVPSDDRSQKFLVTQL